MKHLDTEINRSEGTIKANNIFLEAFNKLMCGPLKLSYLKIHGKQHPFEQNNEKHTPWDFPSSRCG